MSFYFAAFDLAFIIPYCEFGVQENAPNSNLLSYKGGLFGLNGFETQVN